jgi:molybdopterin converting factor small subunit
MKVKVQLYAILSKYLPSNAENKTAIMEFTDGASVKEILQELKIPEAMPKILLVNGRHAELDKPLAEGDTLSIFPPIAGGKEDGSSGPILAAAIRPVM